MFTLVNIISFVSLVTINIVMLYFSKRKRKYGIFSTILLYVFFFSFWTYILFTFQFNNRKPVKVEPVKVTKGSPINYSANNQSFIEKQNKLLLDKAEKEIALQDHLANAWFFLRLCEIQAFIALLFALFGRFNVDGRNPYYNRLIVVHTLMLIFCVFADISESIFGILG